MEENINKIIVSTLKATDLPTYFIMKPEHIDQNDYITFNYIETDDWYSNDKSELSEYSVTLNFITTDLTNIIRKNEMIKDTLKNNDRFMGVNKFQTVYDDKKRCYLTVFTFKIYR